MCHINAPLNVGIALSPMCSLAFRQYLTCCVPHSHIASGVVTVYLCFFSSLMMGSQMMVSMTTKAMALSHMELCKRFLSIRRKPEKDSERAKVEEGISDLFFKADRLIQTAETANLTLQSLVLYLCSYYLVTTTLFGYACLTVLISGLNAVKLSLAVSNGLFFALYLFSFYSLCDESQKLIDCEARTAKAIQEAIYKHNKTWSQEMQEQANFIKEKYANPPLFSPYSLFTLNRSGFLSTIALAFTYLIVLLQFKTAELS